MGKPFSWTKSMWNTTASILFNGDSDLSGSLGREEIGTLATKLGHTL